MKALSLSTIPVLLIPILLTQPAISGFLENLNDNLLVSNATMDEERVIRTAVENVYYTVGIAYERTDRLWNSLEYPGVKPPHGENYHKGHDFSTYMLFESFFGKLNNDAGRDRLDKIMNTVEDLFNAFNKPDYYLNIHKDTGFYSYVAPDHDEPEYSLWYDGRHEEWGGGFIYYRNPQMPTLCDEPGFEGWASLVQQRWALPTKVDLIILCPAFLTPRLVSDPKSSDLQKLRDQNFRIGFEELGILHRDSLFGILLHEFSHSEIMLGEGNDALDHKYGVRGCFALAKENPDHAIRNADSLALYIFALSLDKYDWSSGHALPVPPRNLAGPLGPLTYDYWEDSAREEWRRTRPRRPQRPRRPGT